MQRGASCHTMILDVKTDASAILKRFDPRTQRAMLKNVINKLGRLARKETKKRITTKYNLKSRDVVINITAARTANHPCRLRARRKELALTRFNPEQTDKGVRVSVIRGGAQVIQGAFVAQPQGHNYPQYGQQTSMYSKYPLVFKRLGRKPYGTNTKKSREEFSVSIGKFLGSDENRRAISEMMARERPGVERFIVDNWTNKKLSKFMEQSDE